MSAEIEFSKEAIALLRTCLQTGRTTVTNENRETFRELARAGVMYPVSGFVSGPEATYRFTDLGWERREEFLARARVETQRTRGSEAP
jgi:hypothetical protein